MYIHVRINIMTVTNVTNPTTRFFQQVVRFPKTVVLLSLLLMSALLWFLPQLTKDTRADAFLAGNADPDSHDTAGTDHGSDRH